MLPPYITVLGIDEKTALILDIAAGEARVSGLGGVTMIHTGHYHGDMDEDRPAMADIAQVAEQRSGHVHHYHNGERFPLEECCPFDAPQDGRGLPPQVWQMALEGQARLDAARQAEPSEVSAPPEVLELVEKRQAARVAKDWAQADALRDELTGLGWAVKDGADGPQVERVDRE